MTEMDFGMDKPALQRRVRELEGELDKANAMLESADFLAEAAVGTLERALHHIEDGKLKSKLALDTLQRRVDQYQEAVKRLR